MKFRTTQRAIKEGYTNIISVGYCNLQFLLNHECPVAYTTRREGWGADIYEITPNTCIVTGYAPFGNIEPNYDIQRKYDDMARAIVYRNYYVPLDEEKKELNALINEFIKEVCKE